MTLQPGEGIILKNSKGENTIILDPSDEIPSIHLMSPAHGKGEVVLELDQSRPRIIFRRKNGRDGFYISCQGDGEIISFCDSSGKEVIRLGFDPFEGKSIFVMPVNS